MKGKLAAGGNSPLFFMQYALNFYKIRRIMQMLAAEEKALAQLKDGLAAILGDSLAAARLYGSRARGDFDERSDIDIAVVVRGLTRKTRDRILEKAAEIELENLTPLSVLVLAEEEFEDLKIRERRIALDIEREGIPL